MYIQIDNGRIKANGLTFSFANPTAAPALDQFAITSSPLALFSLALPTAYSSTRASDTSSTSSL
jgi:hypothetical protein